MRSLYPTLIAIAVVAVTGEARAESPRHRAPAPSCPVVELKDVHLPAAVGVDEIRVVLARRSPIAGAVAIRVDDGRFDRVVRVTSGTGAKRLQFAPALVSDAFQVSLDPVFDAPRGACVERVELVRAGITVATVRP